MVTPINNTVTTEEDYDITTYDPDENALPNDQELDTDDLDTNINDGAVLWSTDWTTETVVSQLNKGNIDLNPNFQRRTAWDKKRQSLFIESLIMGLPIPQIILAENRNQRGKFIVIDGKQRLLTLRQFLSEPNDPNFKPLRLSGLQANKHLNGLNYNDLIQSKHYDQELDIFQNQTIRTVVIKGWKNDNYLYNIFMRINTGSVPLSTQELRQALHQGAFTDFLNGFAEKSNQLQNILNLKSPDSRMRDVELVLRYFAYKNYLENYNGNFKQLLDTTNKKLGIEWKTNEQKIKNEADQLNHALDTVEEIFTPGSGLRKWNGNDFERRINRAVFDIMVYYFSDKNIANAALQKSTEIVDAFKELCIENKDFVSSLESTTKSLKQNSIRFHYWSEALKKITALNIASPFKRYYEENVQ